MFSLGSVFKVLGEAVFDWTVLAFMIPSLVPLAGRRHYRNMHQYTPHTPSLWLFERAYRAVFTAILVTAPAASMKIFACLLLLTLIAMLLTREYVRCWTVQMNTRRACFAHLALVNVSVVPAYYALNHDYWLHAIMWFFFTSAITFTSTLASRTIAVAGWIDGVDTTQTTCIPFPARKDD